MTSDNSPELVSQDLQTWGEENQIEIKYIELGKLT